MGRVPLLLAAIAGAGGTVRAQHPYDTPVTAYPVVNGINGLFTNVGASPVPDGPVFCSLLAAADVWFIYEVEGSSQGRNFRTCPPIGDTSSLPDSVIEVFTTFVPPLPAPQIPLPLIGVACNDDWCGERSSVWVSSGLIDEGDILLIRVASPPSPTFPFPNVTGTFRLEVTGGYPPPNDDCSGAIPLGSAAGTWGNLTNLWATLTGGVPPFCSAAAADVWYTWVAPCSGTATFSTCGPQGTLADTVLQVLTGTCGSLTAVGCSVDACGLRSSVAVPVVAGQTYYVRVGDFAYPGFQNFYNWGTFDLTINYTGGAGTFTSLPTQCAGASSFSLVVSAGFPTPGGVVTYNHFLGNPGLPSLIWIGAPTSVPLCAPEACSLGATPLAVFPGASLTGMVPCGPSLVGVTFAVQGARLLTSGGCPAAAYGIGFEVTNTIVTTIG